VFKDLGDPQDFIFQGQP